MTATHSLPRSSAPPMAPTLTSRTTTSRILTASSTWISIAWETTFRGMIPYWMGKIFVYYWDVVSYAFFCKRPEAGKPIEVRVGDEWKTLESSAHIQIDSTGKFLQQYTYVPRGEEGERLPLDFYPNPKVAPGKKITLIQDSFGRGFFIRDVQGEWMKIQGIDYNALPDSEEVIEEEEWAKVSKASESNPIYWVRWREGRKILIYISEFVYKYSV